MSEAGPRPLLPLLRALPNGTRSGTGRFPEHIALPAGSLFLTDPAIGTGAAVDRALAIVGGAAARARLVHDARGAPALRSSDGDSWTISVSACPGTRAILLGTVPLGVDVETVTRVAANASVLDDWLDASERRLLATMPPGEAVVELACRWVLREAYGKALGCGLDMPLAVLAFTTRQGRILLPDDGADARRFTLYRRDDMVIGIATMESGEQPVCSGGQEPADAAGR